jgi:hypothetical protein
MNGSPGPLLAHAAFREGRVRIHQERKPWITALAGERRTEVRFSTPARFHFLDESFVVSPGPAVNLGSLYCRSER